MRESRNAWLERSSLGGVRELSSYVGKDFCLTHVTLYVAQEEKLGSWEGDLAYICISRCVVYTRAGAGDFIFIFKTSFPSSFRFTERLGKSNCNIEKSPGQCAWADGQAHPMHGRRPGSSLTSASLDSPLAPFFCPGSLPGPHTAPSPAHPSSH